MILGFEVWIYGGVLGFYLVTCFLFWYILLFGWVFLVS